MKRLVLIAAFAAQLMAGTAAVHAQETGETPVTPSPLTPEPVVPPRKPADASETFDANANQQLLNIAKNTGDTRIRIDDLLKSNGLVQTVLGTIRGISEATKTTLDETKATLDTALTGIKTVPLMNGAGEGQAATAAESLLWLSEQLIAGGAPAVAGSAVVEALRTTYNLAEVFKLAQSKDLTERLTASLAGQSLAASMTAEGAYASSNASTARLTEYLAALGTSADLKTSIDLNTRVLIELTQQTNESIRTQAATTTIVAAYFMSLAGAESDPEEANIFKGLND